MSASDAREQVTRAAVAGAGHVDEGAGGTPGRVPSQVIGRFGRLGRVGDTGAHPSGLSPVLGVAALIAAVAVAAGALPSPRPQRTGGALEAVGSRQAVATENAEASRVALAMLRDGGDAVDAAAAAALTLGVVVPSASGIGGGGFALVWRARERQAVMFDFREAAPTSIDPMLLDKRPVPPESRGALIGVPGEVAGLHAMVSRYGSKPWRSVVRPAADLATRGFAMSHHLHEVTAWMERPLHTLAPTLAARLLAPLSPGSPGSDPGRPFPVGTRIQRPELGATLAKIGERGPRAFYEGEVADAMVAASRAAGGALSLADLAAYSPRVRTPLRLDLRGKTIFTAAPPSAGGVMLLQALRAHEILRKRSGRGLDAQPLGSAAYLHTMAEVMRGSLDDRARFIGDPDAVLHDPKSLFDEGRIAERVAKIDPWTTHAPIELRVDDHGTTHICVVDRDGDAVALTTTVNSPFGAKVIAGNTGVVLNDELLDFALSSDIPDDALVPPNALRSHARPTSSMTPTIVVSGADPVAVLGGSGGSRIASSVTLVAVAHLVFGASPGEAIGWPRVHPWGEELFVEPTLSESVREELTQRGETIVVREGSNAVQMITTERVGGRRRVVAAADPRKGGVGVAE